MRILSINPGHDGAVAVVEDGELVCSLEAEKDSFPRHSPLGTTAIFDALKLAAGPPDALAIGGWHGGMSGTGVGYFGLDPPVSVETPVFGRPLRVISSSHERSHLLMATSMAPDAPLDECIILVWEGQLGAFYHWQRGGQVIDRIVVLSEPGNRYAALYAIADPDFAGPVPRLEYAGKLMALAAFADGPPSDADREAVDALLEVDRILPFDKAAFAQTSLYDAGVDTPPVHRAAAYLSRALFDVFHAVADRRLPRGLPLVISGGCGLNCEWNSRWAESPLFSSVFVPPCANDSGSAIGTAADAQVSLGGPCRIEWRVDAGLDFLHDVAPDPAVWAVERLDVGRLAAAIAEGGVVAWVHGRTEIGPRALGHRSLLASPLVPGSRDRLNAIKRREAYRPIAPSCLAEELDRWFVPARDDPYMLFFSQLRTDALPAVTHVDGSARVQSVGPRGPAGLRRLLEACAARTGYGVLCNTSLNYPGLGFINRASDLFRFATAHAIDDLVIDGSAYRRRDAPTRS